MRKKCGQSDFAMSEAEFLLSIMNRHDGWCVIICLVGGGQEINTGEAGIDAWLHAVEHRFQNWQVHLPPGLTHSINLTHQVLAPALHLSTSIRSFRAESLSDFIGCVISGDSEAARQIKTTISDYPLFVTRDLERARQWLRARRRGHERSGLLSSSNALRLRPSGICVEAKIKPTHWFLAPHGDVRASDALENVGTEFDVQGLELDWSCVCWDANYRRVDGAWKSYYFKGTRWQKVNNEMRQRFVANSYRVLLTRARQGMVVFVPSGSYEDATRPPEFYDQIYDFLSECGFDPLLP